MGKGREVSCFGERRGGSLSGSEVEVVLAESAEALGLLLVTKPASSAFLLICMCRYMTIIRCYIILPQLRT